ncbi:MAG: NTP/NDP exchange transporter [Calditrichia bacterium]
MQNDKPKTGLDKLLSLFTEMRAGEGTTAILLTLNVFMILTAYLIAKVVREPLILTGGGAAIKSYSAAAQVFVLMGAVQLYGWLVNYFDRRTLLNYVTTFFAANMILFYLMSNTGLAEGRWLGIAFYVWVGIFSLTIISQFWAFANDIYKPEEGNRLFVIIAFGASAGAVVGPLIAKFLLGYLGVYEMLLVASAILMLSLIITNYVYSREGARLGEADSSKPKAIVKEEPADKGGAFQVLLKNRYLLMIAFMLLLTNWVNTTGEYIIGEVVSGQAAAATSTAAEEGAYIGNFYADYFSIVNTVGLILQLFVVSRIIAWFGVRFAILILPVIALGAYFIIALMPTVLSAIRWAKTAENSTDYSLNNTVRQILFLPTTREEKYKAKVAIDSFFVRAGDMLSAGLVFIGLNVLTFSVSQFAMVNIILVGVWLFLALAIGRENKKRVALMEQS